MARVGLAVLLVLAVVGIALVKTASPRIGATTPSTFNSDFVVNGGFEGGFSPWQTIGSTNFVVYANNQLASGDTAFDGSYYGATNTASAGGSIYQDVYGLTIGAGDTICGSAEVRNQLQGTTASGTFAIWLLGGSTYENGNDNFSQIGNGTSWSEVSACVTATTAHTQVRVQFYPTPGSPTVDMDDVDVHYALQAAATLSQNGGFESGLAPWATLGSTNYVVYANNQLATGDTAYAGTHYGATNTTSAGGGVYQDVTGLTINPGDTICASAEVRNQLQGTGAGGAFVVWLLGGSTVNKGTDNFANVGNGATWTPLSSCATATTAQTQVRIQFYPNPGAPTVDMDVVNAFDAEEIATPISNNGSFENGTTSWQTIGWTGVNVYANNQLAVGDTAYAGTHYADLLTLTAGGGMYQDATGLAIIPGDTFCGSAQLRNHLQGTGASGSFVIWLLGGNSTEKGAVNYGQLGNGSNWSQVSTCVTATTAHSQIRVQFYPNPSSSYVDVDAVEVGSSTALLSNSNCAPNNSCSPQTFADTLFVQSGINAPITTTNEYAMEKWELAEGGGAGCPGQPASVTPWQNSRGPAGNPLNTTQTEPGATNWNAVGVKIFANSNGETCWHWGVLATATTLTGAYGNYGPILTVLRNPASTDVTQCLDLAAAVGNSSWGTGNFKAFC